MSSELHHVRSNALLLLRLAARQCSSTNGVRHGRGLDHRNLQLAFSGLRGHDLALGVFGVWSGYRNQIHRNLLAAIHQLGNDSDRREWHERSHIDRAGDRLDTRHAIHVTGHAQQRIGWQGHKALLADRQIHPDWLTRKHSTLGRARSQRSWANAA